MSKSGSNPFQSDLIENRYHIFNKLKAKSNDFYPKELIEIIDEKGNYKNVNRVEIGEIYSARAFFAISQPIDGEVEFQSGFLDLKILLEENEDYIAEVQTVLTPIFVLKRGSKIKIRKENIIYKQEFKSIQN